jgi:Double zinc ribbon
MPVALFGINNEGLNLAVNLIVLFLVVVWVALVVWTFLDARRRLEDPVLVASATAASLFPFVGTIVYSILRPPEFIEDRRERELEIRAAELRVRQLEEAACPNCGFPIERSYLRCPSCRARVKDPCESCGKPIDPRWSVCPYCEAPVRGRAPVQPPPPARPSGRSAPRREPASQPPPRKQQARAPKAAERKQPRPERQEPRAEEPSEEKPSRPARRAPRSGTRSRQTAKSRQTSGDGGNGEAKSAPDTESQPAAEPERQPATDA